MAVGDVKTHIKGSVKSCMGHWFTYHIQDDKELLFIGFGKLVDIFNFTQVMNKPGFDNDYEYDIFIHNEFTSRHCAINDVSELITTLADGRLPYFNRAPQTAHGRAVMCIETGVKFRNAADAARSMNVNPSRMGYHLKQRAGYRTIRGSTFKYLEERYNG